MTRRELRALRRKIRRAEAYRRQQCQARYVALSGHLVPNPYRSMVEQEENHYSILDDPAQKFLGTKWSDEEIEQATDSDGLVWGYHRLHGMREEYKENQPDRSKMVESLKESIADTKFWDALLTVEVLHPERLPLTLIQRIKRRIKSWLIPVEKG